MHCYGWLMSMEQKESLIAVVEDLSIRKVSTSNTNSTSSVNLTTNHIQCFILKSALLCATYKQTGNKYKHKKFNFLHPFSLSTSLTHPQSSSMKINGFFIFIAILFQCFVAL